MARAGGRARESSAVREIARDRCSRNGRARGGWKGGGGAGGPGEICACVSRHCSIRHDGRRVHHCDEIGHTPPPARDLAPVTVRATPQKHAWLWFLRAQGSTAQITVSLRPRARTPQSASHRVAGGRANHDTCTPGPPATAPTGAAARAHAHRRCKPPLPTRCIAPPRSLGLRVHGRNYVGLHCVIRSVRGHARRDNAFVKCPYAPP